MQNPPVVEENAVKKESGRGDYYLRDEFLSGNSHSNSPRVERDGARKSVSDSESDALIIDDGEDKGPCKKRKRSASEEVLPRENPCKKNKESDDQKFQQVENELEALFAGVESGDDGKIVKTKQDEEESKKPTIPDPKPTKALPIKKEPQISRKKVEKLNSSKSSSGNSSSASTKKTESTKYKKKKKLSEQEVCLEKFRGPFVRIEGLDPYNAIWSNVINSPFDPISPDEETRFKKSLDGISESEHQSRMSGLNAAAMLAATTSNTNYYDENWLCIFCKKNSHYQGMGDLFGPYYISPSVLKDVLPPLKKTKASDLAAKFIIGGGDPGAKKRKRKKSFPLDISATSSSSASVSNESEVWMHEDCICWFQDVQILGHRLIGLERAIQDSNKVKCVICNVNGCTLSCSFMACKKAAHYTCAVTTKWKLNEETFQAFCLDHALKQTND